MRRLIATLLILLSAATTIMGADPDPTPINPGRGYQNVYRGKYYTVTDEGDSVLMVVINQITVFPPLKFKNKKEEEFYWRTVRDVKKALPWAKLIC